MNSIHTRQGWAKLARFADACVDLDLTPAQQIQRLSILMAMVEEISAGIEDALAGRPHNLGDELCEGVREIKAGGGRRYQVDVPKE